MVMFNLFAGDSYRLLTRKNYIYPLIAAGSLVLLGFNMVVLYPYVAAVVTADQAAVDQLAGQVKSMQDFQTSQPDGDKYSRELTKTYERVQQLLPPDQAMGSFFQEIEEYAALNQLDIMGIKPTAPSQTDTGGPDSSEVQLEIKLRGEYFSLLKFMKSLQQAHRFNRLNRFSLKYSPRGLECQINISIFNKVVEK